MNFPEAIGYVSRLLQFVVAAYALTGERAAFSAELESIWKNLEHIKQILVMHQKCLSLASLNEPPMVSNLVEATRCAGEVMVA